MIGADTDFDMVLPSRDQLKDFISHFLTTPVFSSCLPRFYYYQHNGDNFEKIIISHFALMKMLDTNDRPILHIDVNCEAMDALSKRIQKRLFQLSETRIPHEPIYGNVEHPCMPPFNHSNCQRDSTTVTLIIMPLGTKQNWYTDKNTLLRGYVHHQELLRSSQYDYPCLSLNVKPGFYYEYAIFIMDYLRERFPEMGTTGGVGTQSGWTDGFVYSNSIYDYEKIQLPVRHTIEDTLKRLRDCSIIRSYQKYYQRRWNYDRINQFRMVNPPAGYHRKDWILFFSEYAEHVEKVLRQDWDAHRMICATATHIILPKPTQYSGCLEIKRHLERSLTDVKDSDKDSHYCGYLSFAVINGQVVGEFRIPWYMKSYLLMLLEMRDTGRMDYIRLHGCSKRRYDYKTTSESMSLIDQ